MGRLNVKMRLQLQQDGFMHICSKILPGDMANRSPEALAAIECERLLDERMILLRQMS